MWQIKLIYARDIFILAVPNVKLGAVFYIVKKYSLKIKRYMI
jgi:hypothetical protein